MVIYFMDPVETSLSIFLSPNQIKKNPVPWHGVLDLIHSTGWIFTGAGITIT
jgi:hypothetical protein